MSFLVHSIQYVVTDYPKKVALQLLKGPKVDPGGEKKPVSRINCWPVFTVGKLSSRVEMRASGFHFPAVRLVCYL